MMKFIAAILLMAFVSSGVGAASINLCTKDSDCDVLAKLTGDTYYCGTISAKTDGTKVSA